MLHQQQQQQQSQYSYKNGLINSPEHWGDIKSIQNNQCNGRKQSPINIMTTTTSECNKYMDYIFKNGNCTWSQVNYIISDHNIEVTYPKEGCIKDTFILPNIDHAITIYELIQFHIHTSTEHTLDGLYNIAELHLVHQNINNNSDLAVIGLIVQAGLPSPHNNNNNIFTNLIEHWKNVYKEIEILCSQDSNHHRYNNVEKKGNEAANSNNRQQRNLNHIINTNTEPLQIYDIIPDNVSFYRYDGSLTTPPCTENVHWSIVSQPIQISIIDSMELIKLILEYRNPNNCNLTTIASESGSTSRPIIQPLNGRTVIHICPISSKPLLHFTLSSSSSCIPLLFQFLFTCFVLLSLFVILMRSKIMQKI